MDYDQTRFYLFTKSYIASVIVSLLRKRYGIKDVKKYVSWIDKVHKNNQVLVENRKREVKRFLRNEVDYVSFYLRIRSEIAIEITPQITKLADYLGFEEGLLRDYILQGKTTPSKYKGNFIFASPLHPIRNMGYYIPVKENTTQREVIKQFQQIKKDLKELFSVSGRERKDIGPIDKEKIDAFIMVEEGMKNFAKLNKVAKEKYPDDYKNELFGATLELMIGNYLTRIKLADDEKFDKKLTTIKTRLITWYYTVTRRYRLPTIKKLPTILRLINS